jgi:hypothetical protein
MNSLDKIGIAELRLIHAIAEMQPCTVKLINTMYDGYCPITGSCRQVTLCLQKGLIKKNKAPAVPKLNDDERIDVELSGRDPFGRGRRPWIFTLTPAGEQIAAGIDIIIEGLSHEPESNRTSPNGQHNRRSQRLQESNAIAKHGADKIRGTNGQRYCQRN